MTLSAYVDHFAVETSGTGTPLTGFGHQPKLWMPFLTLHTSLGGWATGDFEVGMGVSAGATEMAHCLRMNHGQTGGITRRGTQVDKCLIGVNRNTNAEDGAYDTTSFDADGVTPNLSNAFGSSMIAPYMSLGGSAITGVEVKHIESPTPAGERTYTFLGLTEEPTLLLMQSTGVVSLGYGSTGALFLGAADVNGQWAMMTKGSENNPTVPWRIFRSDRCYAADSGGGGGLKIRASFVSFGHDGTNGTVTLDWDAAPDHSQEISLTALTGTFAHKVGTFLKATSAPWTNTISLGAGETPKALLLATAAMTAMTGREDNDPDTADPHCRGSIGLYDGTRARAIAWEDEAGVSTANIAGYVDDDGTVLVFGDNATGSSNDRLTPAFSGSDAILTSVLEEAVAYEGGYILLGDETEEEPPPTPTPRARQVVMV